MQDPFHWLFSNTGFMPHGHCYLWQPATLWANVGSDAVIAAAYYAIPIALYYLVRERRREIPYPWIVLMFAAFILLCGSTHLMEIWTVWHPDYRLAGLLKGLTGIVSIATTVALFQVIPKAMQLRSPDDLQREVQSRTAELALVNEKLRAEIAARDLAESRLREQDRRKDEFLATLSHELRNPLAPIRHAAELLGNASADPQQQRWGREVIARQANRMSLLLDDLFDLSRITRGRLALKKDRVSLVSVINAAVETAGPLIDERAHRLNVVCDATAGDIEIDALRLSQAISNLLMNAAKYTPRGGQIDLVVDRSAAAVTISVKDTGAGFAPESAMALFEMFSPVDPDFEDTVGGLGIGLSLVKGLVEMHGGEVHAHSGGKGHGATFTITLPAPPLPAPEAAAQLPPASAKSPALARILIADDNRDAADSLALLLEIAGHEVTVVYSGRQALETYRRLKPEAVILDIGMPDITGYEVARSIRAETADDKLLLMAITGWGQPDDLAKTRAAGFDRHLTKPVAIEEVQRALNEFLNSRA
jgi:signal transduction histidine kinase/ActR/RegA family two-component response regulator